jgi:hypothetical protein
VRKPGKSAAKSAGAKARRGAVAEPATGKAASRLIDERIRSLGGWRAEALAQVRRMIHEAAPDIIEECKWVKPGNPPGVPVWSRAAIVCTGEAYKQVVKLTFARGASLKDPRGLFNSSLEGNTRRAIDIREGEALDAEAFAAMPGWKRDIGKRLDALIVRIVPDVRKAVKWNSPFYGIEGQGWLLSFHVFTRSVKVTFFRGTSLRPVPPGGSGKDARWIDIKEDDLDEAQMATWVKQTAALPGWIP